VFDEADKHFDLLFNAIRAGRSLAASYNLQSDIQCNVSTKGNTRLTDFCV
jgi:valyl-tRNA synthetase